MKRYILFIMIIYSVLICYGCKEDETHTEKNSENQSQNSIIRVDVNSVIYSEFSNFYVEAGGKPRFSADEWMNESGELLYPYREKNEYMKGIENIFASLYIPEDVVQKAKTKELLIVLTDGWFETYATMPSLYTKASTFANYTITTNIGANELMQRADMPQVVFEDYCSREYIKQGGDRQNATYEASKIQFDEILLGSNHAFLLMNDDLKEKVLAEAMDKNADIVSGNYDTDGTLSGFFSIIEEEHEKEKSLWYEYICEKNHNEVKKYIDMEYPSWR